MFCCCPCWGKRASLTDLFLFFGCGRVLLMPRCPFAFHHTHTLKVPSARLIGKVCSVKLINFTPPNSHSPAKSPCFSSFPQHTKHKAQCKCHFPCLILFKKNADLSVEPISRLITIRKTVYVCVREKEKQRGKYNRARMMVRLGKFLNRPTGWPPESAHDTFIKQGEENQ